jgi:hypothetical protein
MISHGQANALSSVLEDLYFKESDIGSMELMMPGLVDVSHCHLLEYFVTIN